MIIAEPSYTLKCLCKLINIFLIKYNICILYIIMSELYEEGDIEPNRLEEAVKKIIFTEEIQKKNTEKIEEGNCCSICLEQTNKRPQLIMMTECGHTYHYRECWKKYFEAGQDKINTICRPCPMCRRLLMFFTRIRQALPSSFSGNSGSNPTSRPCVL